jgi:hypothetical protein
MWVAVVCGGCTTQQMATILNADLGSQTTAGSLTFYKDVLPLAQTHCTGCHYPGGIGPFSMLTYADVQPEAQAISEYISNGLMPPWKPADGCRSLQGSRELSQSEKDVFTGWAAGGAVAGDPADAPPTAPGLAGLPTVSVQMKMAAAYTPPVGVTDQFQCFILDPKLTSDVDLIGYNVQPGVAAEVHHVLLFPAAAADAQALDDADPDVGWSCFGGPGTASLQTVGAWVPGSSAVTFPANTGIALTAGQVIVLQVHYNLSYVSPSPDQTTVQLQYASAPVAEHAVMLPLSNNTFSIPPAAVNYVVNAQKNAPANATIWGVLPHEHTHGQSIEVQSGSDCMINIPAWDFHWQQMYFFTDPLAVTNGQKLNVTCTYDNPGATPITYGEDTADEMCLSFFYVTQ